MHSNAIVAAAVVFLGLSTVAPVARADTSFALRDDDDEELLVPEPPPLVRAGRPFEPDPGPTLQEGGFEVGLGLVSFEPSIAHTSFTAGANGHTFHATGAELGFARPHGYGVELSGYYLQHGWRIGLLAAAGNVTPDRAAADTPDVRLAAGGALEAERIGLDFAVLLPIDRVRIGLGGAMGAYVTSIGVPGLGATCPSDGKTCRFARAYAVVPFVQPRVSFDVVLTSMTAALALSLGGFVGVDVANAHAVTGGVTLSLHTQASRLS